MNYYFINKEEYVTHLEKEAFIDSLIAKALNDLKELPLSSSALESIKRKIIDEYEQENMCAEAYTQIHIGSVIPQEAILNKTATYKDAQSLYDWYKQNKEDWLILDQNNLSIGFDTLKQLIESCLVVKWIIK